MAAIQLKKHIWEQLEEEDQDNFIKLVGPIDTLRSTTEDQSNKQRETKPFDYRALLPPKKDEIDTPTEVQIPNSDCEKSEKNREKTDTPKKPKFGLKIILPKQILVIV